MRKILLSILFSIFLLATPKAQATPSEDFFVSNFEAYYDEFPNVQLANGDESMENANCNVIDNSTSTSIDSGTIQTVSNQFQSFQGLILSTQKGVAPTGWNTNSTYYLVCTKLDSSTVTSNDFRYMVAPTIINAIQDGNFIDVYFSPSLDTYTPEVESDFNPSYWLYSPDWFDNLGMQQPLTNCEDNILYNFELVSVCHYNLGWNPQLPSSSSVQLAMEYYNETQSGQVRYVSKSSNYFPITSISPELTQLSDTVINAGENYVAYGSFTDIDSSSFSATIDYGEGIGLEPLILDGYNFNINHQYINPGTYYLTLNITDTEGHTGTSFVAITVEDYSNQEPVMLLPTADTYIKQGSSNENEGSSSKLRLQSSGKNRGLLQFSQSEIQDAVGNSQDFIATLRLVITDNGNNWGTNGRTINLHRLTSLWIEGNGNASNRGQGAGTTWNCAIDQNIENQSPNCNPSWDMTNPNNWPFVINPSATATINNEQTGVVEFDVTQDVWDFVNGDANFGWLIKKADEGANGRVEFGSRESEYSPSLIITFN